MKRFSLFVVLSLSLVMGWAQVEARYDRGRVPVINGRVMFQETIATTLDRAESYKRISEWADVRFNKPNVIVSKFTAQDEANQTLSLTAEEYIVFTNRFFVLDRTRVNYWVEIQCTDAAVTLKMTRINYWYEEEREGGLRFSAEDFITDSQAFSKRGDKLLKEQGKFRKGTIDFFARLVEEMNEALNN